MIDRPPDRRKPRPSATNTRDRAKTQRHGLATRRHYSAREAVYSVLAGAAMGLLFAHCLTEMSGHFEPPAEGLEWAAVLATAPTRRRSPPPYSKRLKPETGKSLWVCVGSAAWDRATEVTWMPGCKLVLPPGTHPGSFQWNCAAGFQDAVIIACGHAPTFDVIRALARCLMAYVGMVLYYDPFGRVHRFMGSKEA